MKKAVAIVALVLLAASFSLYGQDSKPESPPDKPDAPAEKPADKDDGSIIVYIDIKDIVDDKPYKYRVTEYMIARTFELANPDNKEKIKDEWRKRYDWSKFSEKKKEQKLEKDYNNLRKEKGVSKLKLSHIKVVRWRPKPKEEKKPAADEKPEKKENGENREFRQEGEQAEPGEQPKPEPEKKPAKPAPKKKWVDPRETADYLIIGEARFKKGKQTKYFGDTVEWQSIGEYEIKIIRRADSETIKEFKKEKFIRGDTRGQEAAHNRCMKNLTQPVATSIVNMPEFRKK